MRKNFTFIFFMAFLFMLTLLLLTLTQCTPELTEPPGENPRALSKTEFESANSIWYREDFTFEQSFFDVNKKYFDAWSRNLILQIHHQLT